MGNETVRKQTHSERLSEYIDAADRAAKSYAGQTQEIWWAALAATLREALADRQRIEALETATIRTCTPPNSLGVQLDHWPDRDPERSISIAGTPIGINSGATLREAIDKLREDG